MLHFGPENAWWWGGQYIVVCLAASLASMRQMPVVPSGCEKPKKSSDIAPCPLGSKTSQLRTTELDVCLRYLYCSPALSLGFFRFFPLPTQNLQPEIFVLRFLLPFFPSYFLHLNGLILTYRQKILSRFPSDTLFQ